MASVLITFKIMPTAPDSNLTEIETAARAIIEASQGKVAKVDVEPIAFGLSSVNVIMIRNEALGSSEDVEEKLRAIPNVESAEVIDVRRIVG